MVFSKSSPRASNSFREAIWRSAGRGQDEDSGSGDARLQTARFGANFCNRPASRSALVTPLFGQPAFADRPAVNLVFVVRRNAMTSPYRDGKTS